MTRDGTKKIEYHCIYVGIKYNLDLETQLCVKCELPQGLPQPKSAVSFRLVPYDQAEMWLYTLDKIFAKQGNKKRFHENPLSSS